MHFGVTVSEYAAIDKEVGSWKPNDGITRAKLKLGIGYTDAATPEPKLCNVILSAKLKTPNYCSVCHEWMFVDAGGCLIESLLTPVRPIVDPSGSGTDLPTNCSIFFRQYREIPGWKFEEGDTLELALTCLAQDLREHFSFVRDDAAKWNLQD